MLSVFAPLLEDWRGRAVFPDARDYTELCEQQRKARAPELTPLSFQLAAKRSRRDKRQRIVLDELYDGRIALHQCVPVLPQSYHDLLNALVFAAFPRSKRQLHRRQFEALRNWIPEGASRLPGKRTREQDSLTIFDEGGSVVLLDSVAHASWLTTSAPTRIPDFSPETGTVPVLFGHALLEHLAEGFPSLRSSAVVLCTPTTAEPRELLECADVALVEHLRDRQRFREPGADAVLEMTSNGELWLGPPKPSWSEFHRQVDGSMTTKLEQPRMR